MRRRSFLALGIPSIGFLAGCTELLDDQGENGQIEAGDGPAEFEQVSINAPSQVDISELFEITVSAANTGGEAGTFRNTLTINQLVDESLIIEDIPPGEFGQTTFGPYAEDRIRDIYFEVVEYDVAHEISINTRELEIGEAHQYSTGTTVEIANHRFKTGVRGSDELIVPEEDFLLFFDVIVEGSPDPVSNTSFETGGGYGPFRDGWGVGISDWGMNLEPPVNGNLVVDLPKGSPVNEINLVDWNDAVELSWDLESVTPNYELEITTDVVEVWTDSTIQVSIHNSGDTAFEHVSSLQIVRPSESSFESDKIVKKRPFDMSISPGDEHSAEYSVTPSKTGEFRIEDLATQSVISTPVFPQTVDAGDSLSSPRNEITVQNGRFKTAFVSNSHYVYPEGDVFFVVDIEIDGDVADRHFDEFVSNEDNRSYEASQGSFGPNLPGEWLNLEDSTGSVSGYKAFSSHSSTNIERVGVVEMGEILSDGVENRFADWIFKTGIVDFEVNINIPDFEVFEEDEVVISIENIGEEPIQYVSELDITDASAEELSVQLQPSDDYTTSVTTQPMSEAEFTVYDPASDTEESQIPTPKSVDYGDWATIPEEGEFRAIPGGNEFDALSDSYTYLEFGDEVTVEAEPGHQFVSLLIETREGAYVSKYGDFHLQIEEDQYSHDVPGLLSEFVSPIEGEEIDPDGGWVVFEVPSDTSVEDTVFVYDFGSIDEARVQWAEW